MSLVNHLVDVTIAAKDIVAGIVTKQGIVVKDFILDRHLVSVLCDDGTVMSVPVNSITITGYIGAKGDVVAVCGAEPITGYYCLNGDPYFNGKVIAVKVMHSGIKINSCSWFHCNVKDIATNVIDTLP